MNRREYLTAVATGTVVSISGCSDSTGSRPTQSSTTAGTQTTTDSEQPTKEHTSESPTETATKTEESATDLLGIESPELNWVSSDQPVVEALIWNKSDKPLIEVTAAVDWYAENGDYLSGDQSDMFAMEPGEVWQADIFYGGYRSDEVDDFEIVAGGSIGQVEEPNGATLIESSMEEVSEGVVISGRVENETEEKLNLAIAAKLFDSDDSVGQTSTSDPAIPPTDTWAFEMGWERSTATPQPDDYELYMY